MSIFGEGSRQGFIGIQKIRGTFVQNIVFNGTSWLNILQNVFHLHFFYLRMMPKKWYIFTCNDWHRPSNCRSLLSWAYSFLQCKPQWIILFYHFFNFISNTIFVSDARDIRGCPWCPSSCTHSFKDMAIQKLWTFF